MGKHRRTTGGSAQDRRRERRAAERRRRDGVAELRPSDVLEIQQLVAASLPLSESNAAELREIIGEELGGKPSKGTKSDRRLKDNKPPEEKLPEEAALEALDSLARQSEPDARELAAAFVRARRPDLVGFEAEVEAVVRRVLAAAAGDIAWGPEDGFLDLLEDVNKILYASATGRAYDEDYPCCEPFGPRAVDAAVTLDRVLICDGDDTYVAPITIDDTGEPVLSDPSEWIDVGPGWIAKAPDDDEDSMSAAAKMRFALRDLVLISDGATAPPLPAEHEPAEVLPEQSDEPIPAPSAQAGGAVGWRATFVPEAILTEDGRAFAPGALILPPDDGSRELPLTLMAMIETSAEGGHDGAKVAGRIDQLWREASDEGPVQLVKAAGVFSDEEFGQMIARMVENKELTGLSVDIAPLEWEHGPRSDWFDEAGNWIAQRGEDGEWQPAGEPPSLEDAVDRLFGGEDMILVITKGVIGMATVCPFPAFGQASISLAASAGAAPLYRYEAEAAFAVEGSLTASATATATAEEAEVEQAAPGLTAAAAGLAPLKPPAEWFNDPELGELTPLTITADGRVFGHAWEWETCHLSFDECVVAPRSETNYAYFMLGELECEDDDLLAVGKITLDTRHAGQRLSRAEATRHYDDTGTVAAHVVFGEDEFGGWFAGALSPDLTESKLRVLRGATISGDWRGVDGNLELIALLAVNVPGFPVPRAPKALTAAAGSDAAEVVTLTAAGIVTKGLTGAAGIVTKGLTGEQRDELASLVGEVVPAAED